MIAMAQALDRHRVAAWFFLLFSTLYTARIVLTLDGARPFERRPGCLSEPAVFYCLGVLALSVARMCGARNPVPFPELILLAADRLKFSFLRGLKIPATDEFLLAFDRNFGYAEISLGKLLHFAPALDRIFLLLYAGETLAIPLMYTLLPEGARKKYGAAVLLLGALIPAMYRLCPGAGPGYLLAGFPLAPIPLAHPHLRALDAALNTTPSGHFGWALLMFWFAGRYGSKPLRIAAGLFAVGMAIATLGTGEHYIIDLVLSVPFAAGIWALVHRSWRFGAISLAVTTVWCAALANGAALALSPAVAWILTAATIGPFALYRR